MKLEGDEIGYHPELFVDIDPTMTELLKCSVCLNYKRVHHSIDCPDGLYTTSYYFS